MMQVAAPVGYTPTMSDAFGNYRPGPASIPDQAAPPVRILYGAGAPARNPDTAELGYVDLTNRVSGYYINVDNTWSGPGTVTIS